MSKHTVRTPSVEFTLSRKGSALFSQDAEVVRRKGVIFRAGDYPTQQWSMTPADLAELAANFSPVPIDHGHPSAGGPLDGAFGTLEAVELSGDKTTLYGTVAFPRWLEDKLGDAKRRVSASFDRGTRRLRSLSLVTRPQIEDAELLAAFCACHPEAVPATPAASPTPKPKEVRTTMPSKREQDIAALQAMSDEDYEAIAPEPDDEPDDDDGDDGVGDVPSPETAAAFARIAELEAKDRRRDAEVFVDGAIKDSLVLPAERKRLVERLAQFALDDQQSPAQFSDGKPMSRVAEEQAEIRARKPHGFTGPGAIRGHALPNGETAEFSEADAKARRDEWESHTDTGRAALARRNGAA